MGRGWQRRGDGRREDEGRGEERNEEKEGQDNQLQRRSTATVKKLKGDFQTNRYFNSEHFYFVISVTKK